MRIYVCKICGKPCERIGCEEKSFKDFNETEEKEEVYFVCNDCVNRLNQARCYNDIC